MGAVLAEALTIRPMTADDLDAVTELSREQLWPHREDDWEFFLSLGEGIVAERDGRLIGTTMGWRFGEAMATVGMVIVSAAAQGQGVGRRLMEAMIDQLGDRTIVLNATEEGLPLYLKLGFVETGRIYQHQGIAPDVPLPELIPGERVRPRGKADSALGTLYSSASGMDRTAMFDALAASSRTVVLSRDQQPVGFAMLRRFGRGWSIAPVIAPDAAGAKTLILHWLGTKKGRFCRIDITAESGLGDWLEQLGLPRAGSVRTMARGPAPVAGSDAIVFSIAAQALG